MTVGKEKKSLRNILHVTTLAAGLRLPQDNYVTVAKVTPAMPKISANTAVLSSDASRLTISGLRNITEVAETALVAACARGVARG